MYQGIPDMRQGSPPQVRGIVQIAAEIAFEQGITPAGAGNRLKIPRSIENPFFSFLDFL